MSAFVVSDNHIIALVHYAQLEHVVIPFSGIRAVPFDACDAYDAQAICDLLYTQNERSVCERYPDGRAEHAGADGHRVQWTQRLMPKISHIQAIKACECLAYQSCETDDWEDTFAYRFCKFVKSNAISKLDGYEQAAWEIV